MADPAGTGDNIARRCSTCGLTWPRRFDKCYQCGGETDIGRFSDPSEELSDEEAESMKNHFLFDRYLEETGRA